MHIVIIDGQGGGIGRLLVSALKDACPEHQLTAVGTNSLATAAMLKAGAASGATGENAVKVACRRADLIIGPIGIIMADSMLGEVSPVMATAVGQSEAKKLLIPTGMCGSTVVGVSALPVADLVKLAVKEVLKMV